MMRRLRAADADLLRQACTWDRDYPKWYSEMNAVFNSGSDEDLIAKLSDVNHAFFGLFSPALYAVVIVEMKAHGQFEGHLMAQRGADLAAIGAAISSLLIDLLDLGLQEVVVWVAEKHRSVRKLCDSIDLKPDGVILYKGAYHGRVIKWLRHSTTREQLLMAQAA